MAAGAPPLSPPDRMRGSRAASDRRLRILHLLLRAGETSAPYNEHCLAFASRHDIGVCTYFTPMLEVPAAVRVFGGDGSIRGFFRALRRALADGPYDVVHAHAPHVALGLLASRWMPRSGPRAATLFSLHTSLPNVRSRNRLMMAPVLLAFDRIVCCSEASLASLGPGFRRLAGDRITAIPNGVDLDRVDRALRSAGAGARPRHFALVSVGRLIALKRPGDVLEAFRALGSDTARLAFIGDGPLGPEMRKGCLHEGRVEFTGLIPRDAVYARLAAADLFVSASSVEGLPVAVLEAMACGVPVVLSDIEAHREIVRGADFVPLVPPGDVGALAREIARFQRASGAERAAVGAKCRALVEERFGVATMGRSYERIYRELARGSERGEPPRSES